LARMKDFASSFEFKYGSQTRKIWRHYLFPEDEANKKIQEYFTTLPKPPRADIDKKIGEYQKPDETQEIIKKLKEENLIQNTTNRGIDAQPQIHEDKAKQKIIDPESMKPRRKIITKKKQDFVSKALDYIRNKEIEIIGNFDDPNKICIAKMNSKIGDMKFLVFGLDKKSLSDSDLSLALSEGQHENLPVLLLTKGKLTKKGEEFLKRFENMLIINKI
jgi:hypothetical protein